MYGIPGYGYGCAEVVHSFPNLIDAIKRFEIQQPRSHHAIHLAGCEIGVKLLPNGFVELDGVVPTLSLEREVERVMQQEGAVLVEVRG